MKRDGTLERLLERYVPDARAFLRLDASGIKERLRTVLPQYQPLFRDAQEKTGIEWRLLAALAFQESKWDAAATSETGVRGLMQLTEDTAKRMGVTNLLDPAQNILAGARYLVDIRGRLPERIQEPDRTRPLAAYNIGPRPPRGRAGAGAAARPRSRPLTNREEGAALLALPEHYERASLAMRAAECPSPSSIACAATTTCCSRTRSRSRRGCACSSDAATPALPAGEATTAQR